MCAAGMQSGFVPHATCKFQLNMAGTSCDLLGTVVRHACMRAGALYATNIGALHPLGIEGWRFAFLSVGLLSATIGKHTLMPLPHQLIMDPL